MAVRRSATSPLTERDLFVAYPFLPGAERLVTEVAPTLRVFVEEPAFDRARELGRARVRWGVDDPTGSTGMAELNRATGEERFLAFLYAWLLLSAVPTRAPLRRWAVAEAKASSGRLRSASVDELIEVARRLGHRFERDDDTKRVRIAPPDYLRLAVPIREGSFRLVQQDLRHGWVAVGRERAARLLQEAIRRRLGEPIELDPGFRNDLSSHEGSFLVEVQARVPPPTRPGPAGGGKLLPERFPPCIRKMRRSLEAGENLSHAGRFALAAFLHRVGASPDAIVDQYRGAPDFDEGITRYQVEQITQRDGGRGYEPPGCQKLRTDGLCFREGDSTAPLAVDRERDPTCFDERLRRPLQYYQWKGGAVVEHPGTT
ncbi:MAG: hypothetical protein WCA77_06215 [Thermoplasmata archaeon]